MKKIILEVKSVWYILIIFIMCNFKIYPASEIQTIVPFSQNREHSELINNDDKSDFSESMELIIEHQPFEDNKNRSDQLEKNMLQGPVDPPIAGIPVDNSFIFMIFLVLVYCIFIRVKRKPVDY